jgi:hypothetical protein
MSGTDFTLGRQDDADSGARALIELGNHLGSSLYTLDAVIVRVSVALLRGDIDTAATRRRWGYPGCRRDSGRRRYPRRRPKRSVASRRAR